NMYCTWPPTRSMSALPVPLYAIRTTSIRAIDLNSSPAMCGAEPFEPAAQLSCPGRALARAINSGTVLAGSDGCATRRLGTRSTTGPGRDPSPGCKAAFRRNGRGPHAVGEEDQGMPAGGALAARPHRDRPAGAAPILDDDLLAHAACHSLSKQARHEIGPAPDIRGDDTYGLDRIGLAGHLVRAKQKQSRREHPRGAAHVGVTPATSGASGSGGRRNGHATHAVLLDDSRHEAGRFDILHEFAEIVCAGIAAFRRAHRLLNRGEPAVEDARARKFFHFVHETRLEARARLHLVAGKRFAMKRSRPPHPPRALQVAAQV